MRAFSHKSYYNLTLKSVYVINRLVCSSQAVKFHDVFLSQQTLHPPPAEAVGSQVLSALFHLNSTLQ